MRALIDDEAGVAKPTQSRRAAGHHPIGAPQHQVVIGKVLDDGLGRVADEGV